MFTGIITGLGQITEVTPLGPDAQHGLRLTITTPRGYLDDAQLGDSIALNGACMTLTCFNASTDWFSVDVSAESLNKTAGLDHLGPLNLEKALRATDRLGGHIVSGHVDGLGQVTHVQSVGESWELRLKAPPTLARFLAYKGSVTINGVSLTINAVHDIPAPQPYTEISINLIPHTLQHTTLGTLIAGHQVNLEIDLIARYCERMLSYQSAA
jgi:riboflavin synthase